MKTFIVLILCSSLVLQGCYSYSALTDEEKEFYWLGDSDSILITLADGTVLESGPFCHAQFEKPADFVYGSGRQVFQNSLGNTPFVGVLMKSFIDSTTLVETGSDHSLICYLWNGTAIKFSEGDYFIVTANDSAGFWCAGTTNSGGKMSRWLSTDEIKQIEVKKMSILNSILFGSAVLACFAFVAAVGMHGIVFQGPLRR